MASIKPVRLVLNKPLSGPYERLLRRPGPEVAAWARGEIAVIIRGTRLVEAMPVWEAETACYYQKGRGGQGWSPEDFSHPDMAAQWQASDSIGLLAVPTGYFKLPNDPWVSHLADELTPWRSSVVEAWRQGVEKSLWITVLRLYGFRVTKPKFIGKAGLHVRVKPLQLKKVRPVISEAEYALQLDSIQKAVAHNAESAVQMSGLEVPTPQTGNIADLVAETGYGAEELANWCDRLRRKKQLIINGPPGTGKTYLAQKMAHYMAETAGGCVDLVQFHASYAYEDFVQGIRPILQGDQLGYELAAGHFLEFCQRARQVGDKPCVLVIDEINRAHLARVFGELMYLLEYRDRTIALAAGGARFSIPDNVHIIATMNTADRSIAMVDLALRRRFSSIRLGPHYELLEGHLQKQGLAKCGLVELLRAINRSIGDIDYELGMSFFLVDDLATLLPEIWQGEIEPYLEEVFYDRPGEIDRWRWREVVQRNLAAWSKG